MRSYRVINKFTGTIFSDWMSAGQALIEMGRLNRENGKRGLMPVYDLSDSSGWFG